MPPDITIIVPAFNEEKNISGAVDSIERALAGKTDDYEIIVINDGSQDKTGPAAEARAQGHPHIRVIHNKENKGFGYAFRTGVELARKSYTSVFPGDNDMSGESLRILVENAAAADVICSYPKDMLRRSFLRRLLSKGFGTLMGLLFGLKLKYYNGSFVASTKRLQQIPIHSNGLTALAECLIRLIKGGCTYKEVACEHVGRQSGRSTALNPKSIAAVLRGVFLLWKDVTFSPPNRPE